VKAAGA